MSKTLPTRGPGPRDINRYARLSRSRNGTVRKVVLPPVLVEEPPKPPPPQPTPAPKTPFDGERQTMLCLYLHLFTSSHPEEDVAREFFRVYRHLLEGGTLQTVPLSLVNRAHFLEEVENVRSGKTLLLDYPHDPTAAPVIEEEDPYERSR